MSPFPALPEPHSRTVAWTREEQDRIRRETGVEMEANDLVASATMRCGSAAKALRYVEQEVNAGPVKLAALAMLADDAQMEREAQQSAA